jgi:aryl carrier-like protein
MRQGYVLVKVKELLAMLDYSLSDEAMGSGRRQFIIGFDYRSLNGSDNQVSLANPMFSHLLQTTDNSETKQQDGEAVQSIEDAIAAATTIEQMGNIVAEVIARKISTLVAVAFEEIDLQRGVIEFGLDSLVVIELKNWISRKFQATLQASEISDAQHIIALAMTVASRSALVAKSLSSDTQPESNGVNGTEDQKAERNGPKVNGFGAPAKSEPALPKQPLPALDDTLNQYRDTIRGVLTKKEYAKMVTFVEEFRHTGGVGRTLQRRLEQLANNPQIENWQSELYARHGHLRDRTALVPYWNFFFTHLPGSYLHSAAERAAVISAAAFQFKQQLDAGDLKQELVNDQPVSMDLYSWLFNATREPRLDEDKVIRYPGNDYVVAFRRGNLYKIPLRQDDGPVSYAVLKRAFQAILDADQPTSWLGVLTADERNSWAKVSKTPLRLSQKTC